MKVYLTKTMIIDEDDDNRELTEKVMKPTHELVSETCNRILASVEGEAIIFVAGNVCTDGFIDCPDNLFILNYSSYGDEKDALAIRKMLRRSAEAYKNSALSQLVIFPNFDGEEDKDEEAPMIQIAIKVFLEKGEAEVVEKGACRRIVGGRVDANYICREIKKSFREKYD